MFCAIFLAVNTKRGKPRVPTAQITDVQVGVKGRKQHLVNIFDFQYAFIDNNILDAFW